MSWKIVLYTSSTIIPKTFDFCTQVITGVQLTNHNEFNGISYPWIIYGSEINYKFKCPLVILCNEPYCECRVPRHFPRKRESSFVAAGWWNLELLVGKFPGNKHISTNTALGHKIYPGHCFSIYVIVPRQFSGIGAFIHVDFVTAAGCLGKTWFTVCQQSKATGHDSKNSADYITKKIVIGRLWRCPVFFRLCQKQGPNIFKCYCFTTDFPATIIIKNIESSMSNTCHPRLLIAQF